VECYINDTVCYICHRLRVCNGTQWYTVGNIVPLYLKFNRGGSVCMTYYSWGGQGARGAVYIVQYS